MSKERFFRIESNLKEDIIDVNPETMEITYGHDSYMLEFKKPTYQHTVQALLKEYGKEINNYEDLCYFVIWMNKKKIQVETIPKIYYIENNGTRQD